MPEFSWRAAQADGQLVEGRLEAAAADAVLRHLRERGIEDPEYWQWKLAMADRYAIDTTPLLQYLGEPAR